MTTHDPSKDKHNSAGSGIGQPQAGPSAAREGKPQGRGFHKPSPKHTLEEVLKSLQDLIRNDLLDAKSAAGKSEPPPSVDNSEVQSGQPPQAPEKPSRERATPAREDFAPTAPESGPVNLGAVMRSLKDLIHNELDTGAEPAAATDAEPETIEAPLSPVDARHTQADADETAPEEFAPLDEELTLDETAPAVPPPPPASALPELPGDIEQELIVEAAPPVTTESVGAKKTTPATQQELPFDAPPPPAMEARLPPPEPPPQPANEPARDVAAMALEIASAPPPPEPKDALPTIEVEENFDAAAYFETAPESAATIAAEIQNAVLGAGEMAVTPEPTPPDVSSPEIKTTLELATAPAVENTLTMPSVDFDTVGLQPPREEPSAPPPAGETPSPQSEPAVPIAEASAPATATTETTAATPPAADVVTRPEATTEPASPPLAKRPPFNLDDIPVLQEVVAPPAGSTLLAEPPAPRTPARPSPDRARDLVVRAVAKLNVEMRRSGGIGLDTKTILRLQQLIREELEKDAEK